MISLLIIFSLCFLPNLIHSSVPFVLNPDCNQIECKDFNNTALYYANHLVGDSKIHIIFSSFEELTIMVIQTNKMASAVFNYTTLYNALSTKNYTGALGFNDTNPTDSFTLVIRRLIEFNDINDSGMMDVNDNTTKSYFLSNLTMTNITFANNNTIQPVFEYQLDQLNGTLKIDIVYPGETKRDSKFPKLKTEPSSYFVNIALTATTVSFPKTRFAFELYLIAPAVEYPSLSTSRYIDDQYTPGIFNVWQMKASNKALYPSSMLWKPVVYLSEERSIEENTLMQVYSIKNNITLDQNIDQGIYYSILPKPNVSAFNVSLGETADGFFAKSNYGFIQFTAGLDTLKPDATAGFVTIALVVSLALPTLVGIIALIFILKRRLSERLPSSYGEIRN